MKKVVYIGVIGAVFLILCTTYIICTGGGVSESENDKSNINANELYEFDLDKNQLFEGQTSYEQLGDYQICFRGKIDSFDEIAIGKGRNENYGGYVTIKEGKVEIYAGTDGAVIDSCILDDFDFKEYLNVNIVVDLGGWADIELISNGNRRIVENVHWSSRRGEIFVESDDSTKLHECALSYYANGWEKPIWLFGDSYFNLTAESRWTYYLVQWGGDSFMLNGFPGEGSDQAIESLKCNLQYAIPKEIIWCMGMNDGGDMGSISQGWKKSIEELKCICEDNDIELVLATIPTCQTVNNDKKNMYVRNSGYRYIDFSKAVGADYNVMWNEGFIEDGDAPVHPSIEGARVLYSQAITTCPELLKRE